MRSALVSTAALLALSVMWIVSPATAARREPKFSGVKKCAACHQKADIGDQQGRWLESRHAHAFETLAGEDAKKLAMQRGLGDDPRQVAECLECHTAAQREPKNRVARSYKPEEGVSCEACHGPGSLYRKKKVMLDAEAARENGLVDPDEKVCVRCHNDRSPSWNPSRYTLADGTQAGFDFLQAAKKIAHPVPEGYDPTTSQDDGDDDDE